MAISIPLSLDRMLSLATEWFLETYTSKPKNLTGRVEKGMGTPLRVGSSTLCWHCFEHNRQFVALGIIRA